MALLWAADAFAVWAGLAAFGLRMGAPALTGARPPDPGPAVVPVAERRVARRRGGRRVRYRVLILWLPLPVSLAFLQCCGRWANSGWSG